MHQPRRAGADSDVDAGGPDRLRHGVPEPRKAGRPADQNEDHDRDGHRTNVPESVLGIGPPLDRCSAGNDRRGERHPMILRPGRSERRPRATEHVVGSVTEDGSRPVLDLLGVEELDVPAARARTLGEHLAVHDRVGTSFVGWATLDADVVGEVDRPGSQRHRQDRIPDGGSQFVQRG